MFKTWEDALPHLAENFAKKDIFCYDGGGFTRELTKEQKEKIKKMEEDNEDIKVMAVIDASYMFGNERSSHEEHHESYLLMDKEGPMVESDGSVEILACVVNKSYHNEEDVDSIYISESLGLLKRIS